MNTTAKYICCKQKCARDSNRIINDESTLARTLCAMHDAKLRQSNGAGGVMMVNGGDTRENALVCVCVWGGLMYTCNCVTNIRQTDSILFANNNYS